MFVRHAVAFVETLSIFLVGHIVYVFWVDHIPLLSLVQNSCRPLVHYAKARHGGAHDAHASGSATFKLYGVKSV